tara:strand:- start:105 stop:455 length:351 start_codon:yes stop_codon:yes gene_type:complete
MRQINHILEKSKSGKSMILKVEIKDKYGNQKVTFSSVKGWRMFLAQKHLLVESDEWNDDVARKFVGMEILRCSKNEYEATKFLNIVKNQSILEIHFWASKFMLKEKAGKAWRALYV